MKQYFVVFFICCFSMLPYNKAEDTLTPNQSIGDGNTLISAGNVFELGFFSPDQNNERWYVGIWHYKQTTYYSPDSVCWIADRENPIFSSFGAFTLQSDGNLVVLSENSVTVWSTNVAVVSGTSSTIAVLMDSGNLVIREGNSSVSGRILWESFDHPSHAMLPGMKIGKNLRTGEIKKLTSWKSNDDPAPGRYEFGIDPQELNQFFIWQGSIAVRRVIFWKGISFVINLDLEDPFIVSNNDGIYFKYYSVQWPWEFMDYSTLVMEANGTLTLNKILNPPTFAEKKGCSGSNICGGFGSCNENNWPLCKCLPGYEPVLPKLWDSGDWSSGCTIKTLYRCDQEDGFLVLKRMNVPSTEVLHYSTAEECRNLCLVNCGCKAYAFTASGGACRILEAELRDVREEAEDYEAWDLYIRVGKSQLLENSRRSCQNCGINIIPYPLSTSPDCGDPTYHSFQCDINTGKLRFNELDGSSYVVSSINPETRRFVIQLNDTSICWKPGFQSNDIHLNDSLPFLLTNSSTVLLLNCSTTPPSPTFNCFSSSVCRKYIEEATCFDVSRCCSYVAGSSWNTSHVLGISSNNCITYTSIIRVNLSQPASSWQQGVEIEWSPPLEPKCNTSKDCAAWPHSNCLPNKSGKRICMCNPNFRWDRFAINCTPEGSDSKRKRSTVIITTTTIIGILLMILACCFWRMRKGNGEFFLETPLFPLAEDNIHKNGIEIPSFEFESIANATENFSDANKLGQGGFGPVYKGKLSGGQEIAVKRLSRSSGQGLEEFKNEVTLIAKLQHKNLVRLIGYCIAGDEKMVLYEYMPNKSLNYFLFDNNRRGLLDWDKRFDIIMGIARGVLYLHQDSRLRIIHRDLKTSNILLDEEMNPKISDFGMARIFGNNQTQENTNRVVGTYGYMSPEYASHGLFSVKSDVFSFGVILLEIISGMKNTSFYHSENTLTLIGHAWKIWKEDKGLDLVDPSLREACNANEVMKCIHVGLLCVQEDPRDRPTMSSVVLMLASEYTNLPIPKNPAFFIRNISDPTSSEKPEALGNIFYI
ncbi:G-type lectin S-receptor-like serine/threonine-protein kinase At4g03230 isoform X2 [Tasmannia lanceolata]|uniref:G-type lectin S-receptor-like serine/threonine-protein kinase At4g03230 isoform X2 n=1 Tax=Tasmannia lanceolata TaxID=3420 RepID=UPI004063899B